MNNLNEVVKLIQEKEWVDLTHNVHPGIPKFHLFKPIEEETLYTIEEAGFFVKKYHLTTQYGTHVDAPCHFSLEHKTDIASIPIKDMVASMYVLHLEDEVAKDPDFTVQVQHILDFEAKYGKIEPKAFVAFCSNWSKKWEDEEAFKNLDADGNAHTPGWSVEAVEFLCDERDVVAIGHENLDTDSAIQARELGFFYAEKAILDRNKYQIEVMTNLDKVPPVGAMIMCSWPKVDGAPGFPARCIAILP